jgi:hypothetical protein
LNPATIGDVPILLFSLCAYARDISQTKKAILKQQKKEEKAIQNGANIPMNTSQASIVLATKLNIM